MHIHLAGLVATYGYGAVFGLIFIESTGFPVPGEGILLVTALAAAKTHQPNIIGVITVAAMAAFLGSNFGFVLGRSAGLHLFERYGGYIGLSAARLRLGRYLFLRHGGKVIFFGRFIAFLRAFEGILAGVNSMPLRRFLIANALGAVVWSSTFGLGAYVFGRSFAHLSRPIGLASLILAILGLIAAFAYGRSKEAALQQTADAALAEASTPGEV